ncbi:MAG: NYN domain-containing protein [Phycisphaerales bacterium]|nr:NYN domain-containing protein [Phycisphaerales bacterium]
MSYYVYVDGESLFVRTEKAWQGLHGSGAGLDTMAAGTDLPPKYKHAHQTDPSRLFLHQDGKFFWDTAFLGLFYSHSHAQYNLIDRAVYFTSFSGSSDDLYALNKYIRSAGFEPHVVHEPRTLADRRKHTARESGLIEKAKGVDVALAVRMLEDAHRGNFDTCFLFTSDVDFLPAVEAVRRLGRKVNVIGYAKGLSTSKPSPLEHVPDRFFDLSEHIASEHYRYQPRSSSAPESGA